MKVIQGVVVLLVGALYLNIANAQESGKWESPKSVEGAQTVTLEQAKQLYADGIVFIDVRSSRQYGNRHIMRAVNLPLKTEFTQQNLLMHVQKDEPLVLYCNGINCGLSYRAAKKAVEWGFTRVKYFREGIREWGLDDNPMAYAE